MHHSSRYFVTFFLMVSQLAIAEDPLPPEAGLPVIPWQEAGKHVGEQVVVQGKIVITKNAGKICFLNFDRGRTFTAVVHDRNFKAFPEPPEKLYDNKLVRIRGVISEFNRKPQIEVSTPDQVTILADGTPLPPPTPAVQPTKSNDESIKIGTYNLLNLFDAYDDPYHDDEGTEPKPKDQLEKAAATIRALNADVLALEEVECRGYLERFVAAMLPDMGYREIVCIDSNDRRGIDCAVLSRLPVGPVTSYRHIKFNDGTGRQMGFQRDLLQVRIEPPNSPTFDVFVVHLKSKRGESQSSDRIRLAEARQARIILDGELARNREARFVICGDFNDYFDSPALKALRGEGDHALHGFVSELTKGTCTYNKAPHRSMIDFVFASPALAKLYVPASYCVLDGSVEANGSDHNPVGLKFRLK